MQEKFEKTFLLSLKIHLIIFDKTKERRQRIPIEKLKVVTSSAKNIPLNFYSDLILDIQIFHVSVHSRSQTVEKVDGTFMLAKSY